MTISLSNPGQKTILTAEVVGVFQKEEQPVTTLLIRPFTIEVEEINDAHLGDEASIELTFSINAINVQPLPRRQI
ncbi:MAG: hypothetical protein WCX28_11020 [Bacteriovoracaceae bacterium]|nr:hypothetical protein [Bacteroidota bacterium]